MRYTHGEKLPLGHYMTWVVEKGDTAQGIIEYFENKYGYEPNQILVGKDVKLEFPAASTNESILVNDDHVMIR